MQRIVVLDYGMGNLFSVQKKLKQIGIDACVSNKISDIERADKLILPGVGHFGQAMENIKNLQLLPVLNEQVLTNKTPVLGICLGMQLMCSHSEEGNVKGLGWIDAAVKRFQISDTLRHKVPHTGWNAIQAKKESPLLTAIPENAAFYFVHSYYVKCNNISDALHVAQFEGEFTAAFQHENMYGVQYHPEKSHEVGTQLIRNFINL